MAGLRHTLRAGCFSRRTRRREKQLNLIRGPRAANSVRPEKRLVRHSRTSLFRLPWIAEVIGKRRSAYHPEKMSTQRHRTPCSSRTSGGDSVERAICRHRTSQNRGGNVHPAGLRCAGERIARGTTPRKVCRESWVLNNRGISGYS